jgi:hypothetical protein
MKTIITILTFLFFTLSVDAQTEKQTMLDIDKVATEIKSKLNTYNKIEKNNSVDGYKYVFLNENELKLITVKVIEPNTEKNVDWYYLNGVLTYTETKWFDIKSSKIVKHEKQYLNNGHLIGWVNSDNKLVDNTSSEFKSLEDELNAYGAKLKSDVLK